MDRSLYTRKKFALSPLPGWICPSCSAGVLRQVLGEDFRVLPNATTHAIRDEDFYDYEHNAGVFSGRLLCGNCMENVYVTGNTSTDVRYDDEGATEYYSIIEPKFFVPPLRLINVDERVPQLIHNLIRSASEVFWCSGESCINRLRCVTEEILTFLKIPATSTSGGYLTLHSRIEKIGDDHKSIREALMAAKHMGNDASHGAFEVTRDEVLDAFEVLDHCLAQLFPKDNSSVLAIISRVNSNKGFRPKTP